MVPAVAKSGVRCTVLYQYHGSVSAEVQESSGVRGSTKERERGQEKGMERGREMDRVGGTEGKGNKRREREREDIKRRE